jgi:hypothetical protein
LQKEREWGKKLAALAQRERRRALAAQAQGEQRRRALAVQEWRQALAVWEHWARRPLEWLWVLLALPV